MISSISVALAVALSLILLRVFNLHHRQRHPFPPGPKGLPVIGNMLDMPTSSAWLKASDWRAEYGSIVFIKALGKPYLFVNSYEAAVELLEKTSIKTSGRPQSTMAIDLEDWGWFLTLMPYGETWRKHSVYLHRFGSQSAEEYHDIHARHAHKLLGKLLETPGQFFEHFEDYIGATIMMITYGHKAQTPNDKFITLAKSSILMVAESLIPGRFVVDIVPSLKYIPAWFPGAEFQRLARRARRLSAEVRYTPYEMTKAKVFDGTASNSMAKALIAENTDEDGSISGEDVIANVTGSMYLAGSETTVGTLQTFILAMLLHPEAQRRAQTEIDEFVGGDRLPTFADKESLPYVKAVIDECLRWQTVAPVGVPHAQTEDDIFHGYFIPKGTIIIPNQWAMLHDTSDYSSPSDFRPERFLGLDNMNEPRMPERDPKRIVFGFGRRICPGQQVALDAIYAAVSHILACYEIKYASDESGSPVKVTPQYTTNSALCHPLPFRCSIVPRSAKTMTLIEQPLNFA